MVAFSTATNSVALLATKLVAGDKLGIGKPRFATVLLNFLIWALPLRNAILALGSRELGNLYGKWSAAFS